MLVKSENPGGETSWVHRANPRGDTSWVHRTKPGGETSWVHRANPEFLNFILIDDGFILIGGSEFLGSLNLTQNLSGPSSPPNQTIKTDSLSSSLSFVFIAIFSFLLFFNSLVSISDAFNLKDGVGSTLQLQVLAISMLFFLYSLLGLFGNFKNSFSLHSSILDLVLLFAFVEEFLLFYLQRKDPSGIENRYFDLLLVPILICVVSTVLELRSKKSNFPRLIRGAGLILHGTWFVQMGSRDEPRGFLLLGSCS